MKTVYQSTRQERDRLNRLLRNETYGPALVRLGATGQREILDLISLGDSKAVRARLTELDSLRRQAVRERSAARRQAARGWQTAPGVKVTGAMVQARARMDRIMRTYSGFRTIDVWEAKAERLASSDDIRAIADGPDESVLDRGSEDSYAAQRGELEYSAFWYHWNG